MKIRTADLIGPALDWAVAKCEGTLGHYVQPNEKRGTTEWEVIPQTRRYSTNPAQGQPILERELIGVLPIGSTRNWAAGTSFHELENQTSTGPTMLIAGLRCVVAAAYGDEVEVPDELFERIPHDASNS